MHVATCVRCWRSFLERFLFLAPSGHPQGSGYPNDMKQLSIDIAIKGPGVVVDGSTLLTRHAGLGRVPCA